MTGRTRRRAVAELRQRSCKTKIIYAEIRYGRSRIQQKQNTAEAEYIQKKDTYRSRITTEAEYGII